MTGLSFVNACVSRFFFTINHIKCYDIEVGPTSTGPCGIFNKKNFIMVCSFAVCSFRFMLLVVFTHRFCF